MGRCLFAPNPRAFTTRCLIQTDPLPTLLPLAHVEIAMGTTKYSIGR